MATKKVEKKTTRKAAKPAAARAPVSRKPEAKKTPTAKPATKKPGLPDPTNQMIAQRAYEIWESRGRPWGTEAENWAQAERELRGQS
jgi:hypothetical protein